MQNPFVGPHPLTKTDPIFGRDQEIAELRHLITAERLVLLYSPSGAGKSSVINAGLIPELNDRFDVWQPTRVNTEPPPGLTTNRYVRSAINGWEKDGDDTTLKTFVTNHKGPKNPLLIFDQFEEILRVNPTDVANQNEFFRQLAELFSDPQIWALIVIREDFLAPLLPHFAQLPTHLRIRYRLDFLNIDQAKETMRETALTGGRKFPDDALNALFNNLAAIKVQNPDGSYAEEPVIGNYVEPMQLQVVCRRLWEAMPDEDDSIDIEDIQKFGDVTQALGAYYDSAVKDDRAIREWFQEKLIKGGIRSQVQMGPEQSEGLSNKVIEKLLDTHLVRAEERRRSKFFELAHDRLIEPVQQSNEAWFNANLNEVQRRASLWIKQNRLEGLLLAGEDLSAAEQWAAANKTTPAEREFIQQSQLKQTAVQREALLNSRLASSLKKARIFIAGATFCLGLAAWQWSVANAQKNEARLQLTHSAVQDAANAVSLSRPDHALAHIARALRLHPESIAARTWAADLLLRSYWWLPRNRLDLSKKPKLASFSLDGRRLFTVTDGNTVQFWDAANGHKIGKSAASAETIRTAAFSPEGDLLVTTSADKTAQIWDAATGSPIGKPLPHDASILRASFGPGAKRLIVVTANNKASLWRVGDRTRIGVPLTHDGDIVTQAFSPDGNLVATGAIDATIRLWSTASAQPSGPLIADDFNLNSIAFSPDGKRLVTASPDTKVLIADLASRKRIGEPLELNNAGVAASFSPDGKRIVTVSVANEAQVWDTATASKIGAPMSHTDTIHLAAFSPDGRRVITTSDDRTAQVWDAESGKPIGGPLVGVLPAAVAFAGDGGQVPIGLVESGNSIEIWTFPPIEQYTRVINHESAVRDAAFSPDGALVATATMENTSLLWDASSAAPVGNPLTPATRVSAFAFSPDGKRLATALEEKAVQIWNVPTGRSTVPPLPHARVWVVAFSADGLRLVTGSKAKNGTAQVWDAASGNPIAKEIHPTEGDVASVAFSPDGRRFATASDNVAHIWDVMTGKPIGDPMEHGNLVRSVAFSPDGKYLLTASLDHHAQIWDAATGAKFGSPFSHDDQVFSAVYNHDGTRVLTASADFSAQVWDAATREPVGNRLRHSGKGVRFASFSPDGLRVVTASLDHTARIWDVATGRPLGQPLRHADEVQVARFSPDGRRVVSAGSDGTARVWDVLIDSDSPADSELLINFIEVIGGATVTENGTVVPLKNRAEKLQSLRKRAADLRPESKLSHFIRRFIPQ